MKTLLSLGICLSLTFSSLYGTAAEANKTIAVPIPAPFVPDSSSENPEKEPPAPKEKKTNWQGWTAGVGLTLITIAGIIFASSNKGKSADQ